MLSISSIRLHRLLLMSGSIAVGVFVFLVSCKVLHAELSIQGPYAVLTIAFAILCVFIVLCGQSVKEARYLPQDAISIAVLISAGIAMVLATAFQLAAYINLPVDLLSFAESPFVNDILKLRLGEAVYTPPQDNNSYPYTPGTQILTYLISSALGHRDSIPFFRAVQFSYVVFASIVATNVCALLARKCLSDVEYRNRPLWIPVWFLFLFLIATDSRFNLYTPSLHNDGLAMLVSLSAYWLIVKHSIAPRLWLLGAMSVLPALGFLVKQNQLMWAGIFFIYLILASSVSWRQLWGFVVVNVILIAITVGGCYLLWGDPFLYWIFRALGDKQVSLVRSILNVTQAGGYLIMGLFGGWVLVLRPGSRTLATLWICWLLVFGIESYSSGIGWQANHLGPGIMIAACWFFIAIVKVWPTAGSGESWWLYRAKELVAVSVFISLFGALGFVRAPLNPVPADFFRYVNNIEAEFKGIAAEKVLLDYGSWIYLRNNVVMKDRSATVAVQVGKNQPSINHAMLAETIRRIENKTYDKILARQLDTEHNAYDFQNRGSGVKAAILANYHEVSRIPAVQGITQWWPRHLVAEIVVLVPNGRRGENVSPEGSSTARTTHNH